MTLGLNTRQWNHYHHQGHGQLLCPPKFLHVPFICIIITSVYVCVLRPLNIRPMVSASSKYTSCRHVLSSKLVLFILHTQNFMPFNLHLPIVSSPRSRETIILPSVLWKASSIWALISSSGILTCTVSLSFLPPSLQTFFQAQCECFTSMYCP